MSGINSLSGLNKVNVDFRPAIQEDAQKPENTNQLLPDAEAVPGEAPPPVHLKKQGCGVAILPAI